MDHVTMGYDLEQREAKKQQAAREANEISNAFFG